MDLPRHGAKLIPYKIAMVEPDNGYFAQIAEAIISKSSAQSDW